MAFFTRVNTNVPFLLPEQCHQDGSQNESDSQGIKSEIRDKANGGESHRQQKDEESGRYEYVVDRVLGVEV